MGDAPSSQPGRHGQTGSHATVPAAVVTLHKPASQALHAKVSPPANRPVRAGPGSSFEQAANQEHAEAPFGMFPSTQHSTSQQGSRLAASAAPPAGQIAPGAVPSRQLQPDEQQQLDQAQAQLLLQQQQEPQEQMQAQQHEQKLQQQQRQQPQAPSMSPSGSSTVKPDTTARRRSGSHQLPNLGLGRPLERSSKGQAGCQQQQTTVATAEDGGKVTTTKGVSRGSELGGDDATAVVLKGRASAGEWKSKHGSQTLQMPAAALQATPDKPAAEQKQSRQPDGVVGPRKGLQGTQGLKGTRQQVANQPKGSDDMPTGSGKQEHIHAGATPARQQAVTEGNIHSQRQSTAADTGTGIGKHTSVLKQTHGESQQLLERDRGEEQKEGNGNFEGQSAGTGGKAGGWTGRLKSLFTLSSRGITVILFAVPNKAQQGCCSSTTPDNILPNSI